jgi:hypothetical protein
MAWSIGSALAHRPSAVRRDHPVVVGSDAPAGNNAVEIRVSDSLAHLPPAAIRQQIAWLLDKLHERMTAPTSAL